MEVATGEHGEWVHKLVLAVKKPDRPHASASNCVYNNLAKNNIQKEALEIVIGKFSDCGLPNTVA